MRLIRVAYILDEGEDDIIHLREAVDPDWDIDKRTVEGSEYANVYWPFRVLDTEPAAKPSGPQAELPLPENQ